MRGKAIPCFIKEETDTEKVSQLHKALHKATLTPEHSLLTTDQAAFLKAAKGGSVAKSCFRGYSVTKCRAVTQSMILYSRPYIVPTTLCLHVCLEQTGKDQFPLLMHEIRGNHWAAMKSS